MHCYASGCSSLVIGGKDIVPGGSWDLGTRVACCKQSGKCCGDSGSGDLGTSLAGQEQELGSVNTLCYRLWKDGMLYHCPDKGNLLAGSVNMH